MTQVRWGMVSAGNIAQQFANDAKLVSNAHVAAVAARSGVSAHRFAKAHGIEKVFEGYESLFNDPDIDAVYISTPHTLHVPNALDALAQGKAVMCEKPIATSQTELDGLLKEADKVDLYLMEAMWTWFLPAIQTAKGWVNEGRIGDLLHVNAQFGFSFPFDPSSRLYDPELAGGCLLDMGIYPIALARYFFEAKPVHLNAVARFAPNEVEDDVAMQFEYQHGTAQLVTSMRTTLPNAAYVIGTKGHIYLPQFWRATECHLYVDGQHNDTYKDNRKGGGFEFQLQQASQDIIDGRTQSNVVKHHDSLAFQADMDWVRSQFRR